MKLLQNYKIYFDETISYICVNQEKNKVFLIPTNVHYFFIGNKRVKFAFLHVRKLPKLSQYQRKTVGNESGRKMIFIKIAISIGSLKLVLVAP